MCLCVCVSGGKIGSPANLSFFFSFYKGSKNKIIIIERFLERRIKII